MRPNSTDLMNPGNTPTHVFRTFFDTWMSKLNSNLEHLVSAVNRHNRDRNVNDSVLSLLIDKSVGLYEEYYNQKSEAAKVNVTSMFSHNWLTSVEDAFSWAAGWRPTTAIQLLYSKSGIQLENRLADLCPVFWAGDLGDLNLNQINRIDELQRRIVREERKISEVMATHQESPADTPMVDLSNSVSEMMRKNEEDGAEENDGRVESTLKTRYCNFWRYLAKNSFFFQNFITYSYGLQLYSFKRRWRMDELEKVLSMADSLRMEMLKSVIEILTSIQKMYFLIAAAELHLRLHDWGLKKDTSAIT